MLIGFSIYGLLMMICSIQTLRFALIGKYQIHREWAIRLFALVLGSWIYRIGYGVIMTLLDFAMGAAARSTTDVPLGAMTIDMTVSFLRPSVGKIAVEGTILKPGKTINYCEAIVLNEAGEITAKSSGTFMLRKSSAP